MNKNPSVESKRMKKLKEKCYAWNNTKTNEKMFRCAIIFHEAFCDKHREYDLIEIEAHNNYEYIESLWECRDKILTIFEWACKNYPDAETPEFYRFNRVARTMAFATILWRNNDEEYEQE